MKRGFITVALMFFAVLAFVAHVNAEDAKPAGSALDELKKDLGLSVYLQGGYTYNFEDPESQINDFRAFDQKANSFTLDLAELVFTKDAPVGGLGYKLKISAGETAKFIHSAGLGDPNDPFDVTEAYISYVAPLGKGLRFDFGKMATYLGAEVIEAKDDANYSRSYLFYFAIPFTHTGLKISYPFADALSASAYIVNGWDNATDNNNAKSYGLSIGVTPSDALSSYFNMMYGPEQDNDTANNRFIFDWVATVKPVSPVTVTLNADYGKEKKVPAIGDIDAKWYGIEGIVKYDFSGTYSLAVRGEVFKDPEGYRTGVAQNLKEVTVTPQIVLAQNLLLRPEYRHDWSNKEVFLDGTKKTQNTIALGVMYTW